MLEGKPDKRSPTLKDALSTQLGDSMHFVLAEPPETLSRIRRVCCKMMEASENSALGTELRPCRFQASRPS